MAAPPRGPVRMMSCPAPLRRRPLGPLVVDPADGDLVVAVAAADGAPGDAARGDGVVPRAAVDLTGDAAVALTGHDDLVVALVPVHPALRLLAAGDAGHAEGVIAAEAADQSVELGGDLDEVALSGAGDDVVRAQTLGADDVIAAAGDGAARAARRVGGGVRGGGGGCEPGRPGEQEAAGEGAGREGR
ncbi:hypothetical protein ACFQ2B_16870 [Streptomyces stramineus]